MRGQTYSAREDDVAALDSKELLHLAIDSAGRNQHGEAVSYLKQALEIDPEQAQVRYFLGAEYAQIGMMDRAAEAMAQALEIDPSLEIARFQLGLLHLTSARPDEAMAVWAPLGELPEDHYLRCFKTGLEALARDEFDDCRSWLNRGIPLNNVNQPLNGDMQKVLQAIEGKSGNGPTEAAQADEKEGEHVFVSAYKGNTQH
jgi:tetratricopeptide (TPR) repeat protein